MLRAGSLARLKESLLCFFAVASRQKSVYEGVSMTLKMKEVGSNLRLMIYDLRFQVCGFRSIADKQQSGLLVRVSVEDAGISTKLVGI